MLSLFPSSAYIAPWSRQKPIYLFDFETRKPYSVTMSNAAPHDGGPNPDNLKEKAKHPFGGAFREKLKETGEKLRDTKLYDLKVGLSHKK